MLKELFYQIGHVALFAIIAIIGFIIAREYLHIGLDLAYALEKYGFIIREVVI